ncbi:MAG TPA: zf-TFIIB domain-containing protein [Candidatus Binataceae bacterium]|nr:zf-TFIIB domain-containing protein [Candidatus Binataceae bacterium]
MSDEKDRFGDKIHELEKARENEWAREQDRQLLEKMKARQSAALHCPQCNAGLTERSGGDLTIMACPNGHGAWLQGDALAKLAEPRK